MEPTKPIKFPTRVIYYKNLVPGDICANTRRKVLSVEMIDADTVRITTESIGGHKVTDTKKAKNPIKIQEPGVVIEF
jgi:hypothetical protein